MEQEDYLQSLLPKATKQVERLEEYAKEQGVPIMEPLGIHFLMQIIRMQNPDRILEIGTAIGYSALRMIEASPTSEIVTIERDRERYDEALKNVAEADADHRIHILYGDALEMKEEVVKKAPFDLLFIDAAKGKYEEFFHLYEPLLSEGGVIISDNVLFKGYVADDTEASKRMAKIAKKIRQFNEWLTSHPDYHTTIIPIGDGVAITKKK
ncbi:O-methyltransferase [Halobacillus locisalis]|uniref:tRNA 5-hydroxyuridine methyltransferase n=1 Tax=Halobacillus locisalis TaxID=220753 RepID=A0A838CN53_9BACI|nr:O-methyltransferase [Halobacillus locisalis]MBA2173507.1 O-methyltransferase [Halobacillus locisalis]